MKKFIKSQIDSFNKNTYKKSDLLNYVFPANFDTKKIFKIQIKNNKMIYDKKLLENDLFDRKKQITTIIQKMLDKYKIQDTILMLNIVDGYVYDFDIPIFNYALPVGCTGLIFPNFDLFDFSIEDKKYNFDEMKNIIQKHPIKKIENDIFFRGAFNSRKKTKIREIMEKEKLPFNVKTNTFEFIGNFKKHKYLLDLPGFKPWSIRLKYLFIMNSLVFRISFYDSKRRITNQEKGYFQQSIDYLFKENRDYIHLIYNFDYDKEIPPYIYKKCINDIKQKYDYFENNQDEYDKIVNNMKKASKKINLDEMLKYLYILIETYTTKLLI